MLFLEDFLVKKIETIYKHVPPSLYCVSDTEDYYSNRHRIEQDKIGIVLMELIFLMRGPKKKGETRCDDN